MWKCISEVTRQVQWLRSLGITFRMGNIPPGQGDESCITRSPISDGLLPLDPPTLTLGFTTRSLCVLIQLRNIKDDPEQTGRRQHRRGVLGLIVYFIAPVLDTLVLFVGLVPATAFSGFGAGREGYRLGCMNKDGGEGIGQVVLGELPVVRRGFCGILCWSRTWRTEELSCGSRVWGIGWHWGECACDCGTCVDRVATPI